MLRSSKRLSRTVVLLVLGGVAVIALTGCYHATVNTERAPSAETYTDSFASGWIYGLVPPSTVEASEECPNGVARVETKLSFVNQLVNFLTLGIYTPMHIEVTCAQGSGALLLPHSEMIEVPQDAAEEVVIDKFSQAAERAVQEKEPVLVRFE